MDVSFEYRGHGLDGLIILPSLHDFVMRRSMLFQKKTLSQKRQSNNGYCLL